MEQLRIMDRAANLGGSDPALALPGAASPQPATSGRPTAPKTMSLVDAMASLGSRNNMVTSIVVGGDNRIAQIRVVDAVTLEVIAESQPDSIAHMEQEMQAYQQVARSGQHS